MTDKAPKSTAARPEDDLDLTRSIRMLAVPTKPGGGGGDQDAESRTVLIACRDSAARKWGPKWLRQAGLQATLVSEPDEALSVARSTSPGVIIVEAGLRDQSGARLFEIFQNAADLTVPVIVLCANTKDVKAALDAGVFDVVRKPIEWHLVSRRAKSASKIGSSEAQLRQSQGIASKALKLADRARKHLRSRESFEPVTGLPNKSKFIDLLGRGMNAAERDNNALAVFVVGFSRFRLVVEAMGQESANHVLAEVGKRLQSCMQGVGTLQRQTSGLKTTAAANVDQNRFGLMLTCTAEPAELSEIQEFLAADLSRPVEVSGQTVYLSACVGVAVYPQDADSADSLLQRADNAMRDAQSRGGGFRFYCDETDAAAARKLKIEHMLHEAFERRELRLSYQPLTDVASGRILGAEALLRWQQPDKSYIPPAEFVPIAEECGLMIRIGEFVLDQACRQLKVWQLDGFPSFRMSVNVARCQLMSGGFVDTVRRLVKKHGVDPAFLDLELSERGVLSGNDDVISQLHELKQLGVRLSIDDFGTGDSAIAYLKDLPIDVVKIDRSYISGLVESDKDAAITSAMVALGQRLSLTVVAEGVETSEQLEILQNLGCDEYQGFHLSPAVPCEEFAKLMQRSAQKK
jgi:diguanylate cyclase (GGDEF)-like protein